MASTTHGPSCRCANCTAMRAVTKTPQPGRPSEPFLAPSTPEKELSDDVEQARHNDPIGSVLDFIIDDVDRSEILRVLTLCGIDERKASDIIRQAEERYTDGGEAYVKERRKRGLLMVASGVGIALFAIFAVETLMWLATGTFGSFGVVDAIFVLVGLVQVGRGIHRIATARRPSRAASQDYNVGQNALTNGIE